MRQECGHGCAHGRKCIMIGCWTSISAHGVLAAYGSLMAGVLIGYEEAVEASEFLDVAVLGTRCRTNSQPLYSSEAPWSSCRYATAVSVRRWPLLLPVAAAKARHWNAGFQFRVKRPNCRRRFDERSLTHGR